MKPKMIWANYSVKDAKRTHAFYTQLGFKPNDFHDPTLASFNFGDNNFVIHFFETGTRIDEYVTPGNRGEVIFSLSADTEAEVKELADKVTAAGGTLLSEPRRDEAGYYGFAFADPDDHKFNVLLMDNM
jgi:uncharacterized protein